MAGNKGALASALSLVNPLETLRSTSRGLAQEAVKQANLKKLPGEALQQVTGVESQKPAVRSGDLAPGEVLNLSKLRNREDVTARRESLKKQPERAYVLPGIDYRREVVHGTEMIHRSESTQINRRMEELRAEIARLASSIQAVSKEAQAMSVEQAPQNAGKYQVTFLEWMLSVVRTARMQVEDSGAWMAVSKKKNGYQQKASSLGTKFTQSQERAVVTQTG